ncbi:hypothetical protein [Modestobacter versicolor]|uniref:hypothetical protein n=1 Tax=Modestobacter versicolor TaxID=429133 RepID=UPI0034DF66C7
MTALAGTGAPGEVDVDIDDVRRALEHYATKGWSDGLPVMPVTESYLAEFLATTDQDPSDVVFEMPHLRRTCTVRAAAINAAMAGCLPEYFPVVLAAWAALTVDGYPVRGIWQSTTGTAPLLIVNGPVRDRIGLNSRGNVFGSGFRANATIGRAIRLTAINVFGLRPHELDQATQGTPAKYTACIAENEELSPWAPLHVEHGMDPADSAVTGMVVRSVLHIEARHTVVPEQLALDLAGTLSRTGALIHETISGCLVLGPEHAQLFASHGWSKADVRQAVHERAWNSRADLVAVGKDAVSRSTRWRVPAEHPDAVPDRAAEAGSDRVHVLNSPDALLVVVAGANNAGVSAVVETFGPRGDAPAIARVAAPRP